jgi:hypothetical protein
VPYTFDWPESGVTVRSRLPTVSTDVPELGAKPVAPLYEAVMV